MEKYIWLVLLGGCVLPYFYIGFLRNRLHAALLLLEQEKIKKRSLSASYGRITEQWFPLMDRYPYNPSNFRFLGTPIDGVQFEEDRIVFVEFKSRKAELNTQQRKIKQLVTDGEVYWEEYHFQDE